MSQYRYEVDWRRLYAESYRFHATDKVDAGVFVAPLEPGRNVIAVLIPTGETSTETIKALILRYKDTVRALLPLLGLGGGI